MANVMSTYTIFTRNWWREGADGKVVPDSDAPCTTVTTVGTEQEARGYCREGNAERPRAWQRLGRMYEYREDV